MQKKGSFIYKLLFLSTTLLTLLKTKHVKNPSKPSFIDLVLTNSLLIKLSKHDTVLSDFGKMVLTIFVITFPKTN